MQGWWHNWGWADFWNGVRSCADILIVWYVVYRLMMLAKGTRAWQIITGLLVFVGLLLFSAWAHLTALNWLLQQLVVAGPVAIVILFYPELRHALEEVGRLGFWGKNFTGLDKANLTGMIDEIVRAADALAEKKVGALMVLERETGLTNVIETGTVINAVVDADLLATLFYPGGPLHDGAVIIRRDRIVAAGCTLPLSENRNIGTTVHMRHKAGLGITEESDALAVIVSEERGTISLAFRGKMVALRGDDLRARLMEELMGRERPAARRRRPWRSWRPPPPVPEAPAAPAASPEVEDLPPARDVVASRDILPPVEAGR